MQSVIRDHAVIACFIVSNMVFGSIVLNVTTLVFLFIACIRFLATDSLIRILLNRYGLYFVKDFMLEKSRITHCTNFWVWIFLCHVEEVFCQTFVSSRSLINNQELRWHTFHVRNIDLNRKSIVNRKLSNYCTEMIERLRLILIIK